MDTAKAEFEQQLQVSVEDSKLYRRGACPRVQAFGKVWDGIGPVARPAASLSSLVLELGPGQAWLVARREGGVALARLQTCLASLTPTAAPGDCAFLQRIRSKVDVPSIA